MADLYLLTLIDNERILINPQQQTNEIRYLAGDIVNATTKEQAEALVASGNYTWWEPQTQVAALEPEATTEATNEVGPEETSS